MKRLTVEFVNLAKTGLPMIPAAARLAAWHYGQGRRVVLLSADPLQAQELDRELWTFEPNSFVPHAQAGSPDEADEPVLIAARADNRNQAAALIMLDALEPEEVSGYIHLVYFVPAEPGPKLDEARERYKRLKADGGIRLIHSTSLPQY